MSPSALPDERLTQVLSTIPPSSTYFSLEFFPPKTQAGFSNLQNRLSRMATALRPLFVTVTWGAGGSTASKSLELAEVCQRQLGLTTVLHLTCTNMKRKMVDEALEEAKEIGIRNILALRGDPPREEYKEPDDDPPSTADEFVWAVDLVSYIKRKYGDYFCIGVAGYPEGHADESHPEAGKQSVEHDLPYLVQKVAAGADFIMTQLTYDAVAYRNYEARLRNYEDPRTGKKLLTKIPIIPGLMPIQSYQILKRITKLSHAKIPAPILKRIEQVKDDDEKVKNVGVDILSELVEEIRSMPQPEGVPRGLHFYTLNLEKSVAFILERCRLIPSSRDSTPAEETSDSDVVVEIQPARAKSPQTNGTKPTAVQGTRRRRSSLNAQPHNRVILDKPSRSPGPPILNEPSQLVRHEAQTKGTGVPASDPTRRQKLMISEGHGSLGREATWDDFPNGRWGPSHSPAFGEIDGYGPSLKVGPVTARKLWGHPSSAADVTKLFRRHVLGELEAVPWSDEVDVDGLGTGNGNGALRAETMVIRKELLGLIEEKGFWTLASQPAVNGVRNDDETFGWGPKGEGFVFQKAFVEFFCSRSEWENRLRPRLSKSSPDEFSWMKTDAAGVFESTEGLNGRIAGTRKPSLKSTPITKGVNPVTWGVFRGKEIVAPTIIESESFRAWGEEAFSIWHEWRRCFPRGSDQDACLQRLREDVVLVNIVGQKFIGGHEGDGAGLWKMLLEE